MVIGVYIRMYLRTYVCLVLCSQSDMNMQALQSMTAKCMEIEDELGKRERGVGLVRGGGCRLGERERV